MRRYRFLLSWRWLGLAVLAVVLVTTCIMLGNWQHERYEDRASTNERIAEAAHDSHPLDAEDVFSRDTAVEEDQVWSKAEATGRFDADGQVLVRNRANNAETGYEVLTPLLLDDGTAILVNRGWVASSAQGATALPDVPAPPEGKVTVEGRVRAEEGRLGDLDTVSKTRQVRSIHTATIAKGLDYELRQGYLTDDDPVDGMRAIPVVEEREWQNFAYSYQWWLFAGMVPVGLVMIARREEKQREAVQRMAQTAPV